jgi:TIR domain-containing protein
VIERAGYQPIIQAWDFRPGENFFLRMQQARAELNITIAVMSEAYLNSGFTQSEWTPDFVQDPTGEKSQRIIPVRVTPCTPFGFWSSIIYIDLVGLDEHEAERGSSRRAETLGKTSSVSLISRQKESTWRFGCPFSAGHVIIPPPARE